MQEKEYYAKFRLTLFKEVNFSRASARGFNPVSVSLALQRNEWTSFWLLILSYKQKLREKSLREVSWQRLRLKNWIPSSVIWSQLQRKVEKYDIIE